MQENWTNFINAQSSEIFSNPDSSEGFCVRDDLVVIQVSGDDAGKFLHSQLSQDIERMTIGEYRLAAYCNAKGRMYADLHVIRERDCFFVLMHHSLAPKLVKRLQMFVLRAKVQIADVSDHWKIFGVRCGGLESALHAPELSLGASALLDSGRLFRSPIPHLANEFCLICPADSAIQVWKLLASRIGYIGLNQWRYFSIKFGIPHIEEASSELFVPQMINFEILGGVNFKKGCYPGQEVVARSQYLGKLKRRMVIVTSKFAQYHIGQDVYNDKDSNEACGKVVDFAEVNPEHQIALIQVRLSDLEAGNLKLGELSGVELSHASLPYEIYDVTA